MPIPPTSLRSDSPESESFLSCLLHRMHPRSCLLPEMREQENKDPHEHDMDTLVLEIIDDLKHENKRPRALQRLFDHTDLAHQHNRVSIVCTSKCDVIGALANCLANKTDRRLACLGLNNLSIPFENKAVMVFGPSSTKLLDAVLNVIVEGRTESYLCCILLMNLSYLQDAKVKLVQYGADVGKGPLENEKSLIRTVELLLQTRSRFLARKLLSVEGEAVRWATGLLRNLSTIHEGASLIAKTDIPAFILSYVRDSPKPLHQWTEDSLEDFSLQLLVNLAKDPESLQVLKEMNAANAFDSIVGQGGIHDVRASFLQVRLGT